MTDRTRRAVSLQKSNITFIKPFFTKLTKKQGWEIGSKEFRKVDSLEVLERSACPGG